MSIPKNQEPPPSTQLHALTIYPIYAAGFGVNRPMFPIYMCI